MGDEGGAAPASRADSASAQGAGAPSVHPELNRRIMEVIPGGIVHVGAGGNIVSANAEALRVLGLSYDALTHRYTQDFAPETLWEDGSPCAPEDYPVSRALATGEVQPRVTIGIRRQDGDMAWAVFSAVPVLADDGRVTGAVACFVDITERRRMEEALRDSEARLRSVVESLPAFVMTIDEQMRVTFVNRWMPGVEQSHVLMRSVLEFSSDEDRERTRLAVERTLSQGTIESLEARPARWLGDAIYRTTVGPLRYGNEIRGATMIMEDITHQKEMEARLLLSDRLTAVGTLAAGVAHEINNPLTYLLGNLELLERANGPGAPRVHEALEGAERIRDVVRDLMTFSHPESSSTTVLRVSDVLDRAIRMAQHEFKHRARVVRDEVQLPDLRGNASRLSQVMLNLLINAAHAIKPGDAEHNEIRVTTRLLPDQRVRISISDTGEGIDRRLLGRIFDPFVTTKPTGQGTGLGLYVCHNIVRSLGGTIWVESEPGRGSTFHVDVPVEQLELSPARETQAPLTKKLRILLVDDEPNIRAFLASALAHHDLATVSSGRDAEALLDVRSFDVVLCDLMMPDATGVEVYTHAQARSGMPPRFVFLTGVTSGELFGEVRALGAPVLSKPFTIAELEQTLARVSS